MKIALHILIGAVLLIIALPLVLVYSNTHPPRYPLNIPPSAYGADYEPVSFLSGDGVPLKGWLLKPARPAANAPAVIICHGIGANKSDFSELAASLSRRGFAVLLFDFRAHGDSGGGRSSLGHHEQKDITAALGFLRSRPGIDVKHIGIYGFSMGASAAVLAAARSRAFSAVAVDSAFTSLKDQARTAITGFYHLPSFPFLPLAVLGYELYFQTGIDNVSPVKEITNLAPTPLLIIAGEGDRLIPADNGRRLYAAASDPKTLWIIAGADHGGTLAAAGGEYEKRVGEFFEKHLR